MAMDIAVILFEIDNNIVMTLTKHTDSGQLAAPELLAYLLVICWFVSAAGPTQVLTLLRYSTHQVSTTMQLVGRSTAQSSIYHDIQRHARQQHRRTVLCAAEQALVYSLSSAEQHDKPGHPETASRINAISHGLTKHGLHQHPKVTATTACACRFGRHLRYSAVYRLPVCHSLLFLNARCR